MKSFAPTRDLRFALTLGLTLACAGAMHAQRRGWGGAATRPSRQTARQGFRQPAGQSFQGRQQASAAEPHQAPVERRDPATLPAQEPQSQGRQSQLAPIMRRNPQAQAQGLRGEHLSQWMNQHRNLTPEQQQQALDQEPGFRQLPRATQQRLHNRLSQLDAMNPQERARTQNHIESMEHLSQDQRAQVRGSLEQLGSLPPQQRQQVSRLFRDLRQLPPEQRGAALNSPRYQYMSPAEKSALNNLLRVEPLMPPNGR